jgi:hypothetical protein
MIVKGELFGRRPEENRKGKSDGVNIIGVHYMYTYMKIG